MATIPYQNNAQAMFYQQYEIARRDEVVGILLALFLGTFGIHHFYLRRTGLGILYCCFFWTGIPAILGFLECFFMPGRVREFNAIQAAGIAATLGIAVPIMGVPMSVAMPRMGVAPAYQSPAYQAPVYQAGAPAVCGQCQQTNPQGSRFCSACGVAL